MSEIKKLQENINVKRIDENTVLVHVAKNEIMMALQESLMKISNYWKK